MEYLSVESFQLIIERAIQLKKQEIPFFLINQHSKYIESNTDFKNRLNEYINDLERQLKIISDDIKLEIAFSLTDVDINNFSVFYLNGKLYKKEEAKKGLDPISGYPYPTPNQDGIEINAEKILELREGFVFFHDIITNTSDEIITPNSTINKLKWNGTPSQFGFILQELIGKGWIERPTNSHKKDAEFIMQLFEINTTIGNLENEINPNKNSLTSNNSMMFKIPNINKLQ